MNDFEGLTPEQTQDLLDQDIEELDEVLANPNQPSTEDELVETPAAAPQAQQATAAEPAAQEGQKEEQAQETEGGGLSLDKITDSRAYKAGMGMLPTAMPQKFAADIIGATGLYDDHQDFLKVMRDPNTPQALGLMDFGIDLTNKVAGTSIPKLNKYENQLAQTVRELSSFILPTALIGGAFQGLGRAAHTKIGWGIGNNGLMKWLGTAGIDTAVGIGVDEVNTLNETDDDPLTALVKTWPQTWGSVIPRDWTSLDCDSPQCKKIRNRDQGAVLGMAINTFEGFLKYASRRRGVKEAVGWLPETERGSSYLKEQAEAGAENVIDAPQLTLEQQARNWFDEKERQKMMDLSISPDQARQFDDLSPEDQKGWVEMLERDGYIIKPSDDPMEQAAAYVARQEAKSATDIEEEGIVNSRANPDSTDPQIGQHNDMFESREMGSRTADNMGVLGTAKDQAELMRGKPGRLGSVYSSSALKFSLMVDNPASRTLFKKAKEALKAARDVAYKAGDHLYSSKEISDEGDKLAAAWLKPDMTAAQLRAEVDAYKTNLADGVSYVNDKGYDAALKAIRGYFDEYLDMDELKAAAYVNTSMTGQVSDLAETTRLMEGTSAVRRAQSEIFDRLQILMAEKGIASYIAGRSLNMKNRWKRMKSSEQILAGVQNGEIEMGELIKQKYGDAQRTVDILRDIHRERPEMLGPMMLAYELSNGKIDTVAKLNKIVENNLGGLSKALFDGNPEIPSQLIQALYANYYNSILTSIGTPAKAGFGNLVNMAMKPASMALGGAIGMNKKQLMRAWMQYSGFMESLQRGFTHMGKVFKMASEDPNKVGYIMRDDIVRVNQDNLVLLRSYADAQSDLGNDGPLAILQNIEELNDLANNPILRFGANAMTAFDGFTRAMIGSSEARIRAFDKLVEAGEDITPKRLKELTDGEFNRMFDETGMIVDSQVDYTAREMALSLDNKGVDLLNKIIDRAPILKPFILFPRTQANAIALFDSASPFSVFAREYNDIATKPLNAFAKGEMEEILAKRGISTKGDILQKFETLRAEIRGRKAIGMLTVAGAAYMFMGDNLRGNGYYKKEVQKTRREADWSPRTYRGWDGNWYSYDGMGIFSDFIALTADIGDNIFNGLSTSRGEELFGKMAFILGANLTNKSYLASLEPMMDVLQGNPAAMNRFGATALSAAAPLSGVRREISQLMYPGLREVDDELGQLMRNRNGWLDLFDPQGALPYRNNWVTGGPVGQPTGFWDRVFNATMPMKKSEGLDPREQFLIDIEFETRPIMNKAENGIEFTNKEQEELYSLIGEDEGWQLAQETATKRAKDYGFIEKLDKARRYNVPSKAGEDLLRQDDLFINKNEFMGLHNYLKAELQAAKNRAILRLSNYEEVRMRETDAERIREDSQRGTLNYY